jgi:hypothetical protein
VGWPRKWLRRAESADTEQLGELAARVLAGVVQADEHGLLLGVLRSPREPKAPLIGHPFGRVLRDTQIRATTSDLSGQRVSRWGNPKRNMALAEDAMRCCTTADFRNVRNGSGRRPTVWLPCRG